MTTAVRAASFTGSIGVEIHMEYTQSYSPYASVSTVEAALAYLNPNGVGTGVATLRDETGAPTSELAALGQAGYKLDIYTSYNAGSGNTAASAISPLTTLLNDGYLRMVEGPLEVDNSGWGLVNGASYTALNGNTYTGWQAAVEWQSDLYSTFSGKTEVAMFSLANPSDGAANSAAVQAASQLGLSLNNISNVGNVHFYEHNGNAPATEMGGVIGQETGYTPGRGFTITETGFNDDTSGSAASANYFGTQYSNGVYTLDLTLDAFKAGSSLTDIYELFDENNPSYPTAGIAFEDHWGLFNADGTPKLSATYLHNMMTVLGDSGSTASTFTAGSLNYTVSGLGSNGNSLLMEKSDGAYDIAVWADANVDVNGVSSTAPTQNVTVSLGGTYAKVEVFDPVLGSAAVETLTNVSSVSLGITDHPLIIEIESGSSTPVPPPVQAPPSANDTVVKAGSTAAITDASGNAWTITSGGQIAVNGVIDAVTANVTELAYVKGTIWQENSAGLWYGETTPNDSWSTGTATSPLAAAVPASPNDTIVKAGSTAAITDASGNAWTITSGGQIAVNGVIDAATANVTELAYVKGTIWQENSSNLWYGETTPNDSWSVGTATSPLPVSVPASPNDTIVKAGSTAAITDAKANAWTLTSGGQVAINGATDAATSKVIELAYVNGTIWQQNAAAMWSGETTPNDSWSAATAKSPLPFTASANDTVVKAGSTAAIIDANGNAWSITGGGQIAVNGVTDAATANVTELAYVKGTIWQENSSNLWYGETTPNDSWSAGVTTTPLPVPASANDTVVKAGSTAAITDANGNAWTITSGGQIAVNGVTDAVTANVTELAYVNGTVWQENSANLWYGETTPNDSWSVGTTTSPLPIVVTVPASQTSVTIAVNSATINASSGSHLFLISGNTDTFNLSGGVETITDSGSGKNTFTLPAAGQGSAVFNAATLTDADTFNLTGALKATPWTGTTGTIGSFLHTLQSGANTELLVSATATTQAAGTLLATFDASTVSLSTILGHSIT